MKYMYYGKHPIDGSMGFFDDESKCVDPVQIDFDYYCQLFKDQEKGLQIVPDENGKPITVSRESLLSDEEKKEIKSKEKRFERDSLMDDILWKIDRFEKQEKAGIPTTDSKEVYLSMLRYLEYLRNVPQDVSFPDIEIKSFDAWDD